MTTFLPQRLQSFLFSKFIAISGIFCWLLLGNTAAMAQGPGSLFVDAGPDVTVDCNSGSGCAELTASFLETFESLTNQYTVESITYNPPFPFDGLANQLNPNADDQWSIVEQLPFDFCYFENIETQFQVGSNGVIRFDVDPGDTSNGWSFDEDLPNNSNATLGECNVFTPGHDIDPSVSSSEEIGYEVLGDYPNRVLVVAYYEVPMYSVSCNSLLATQMVVFYEFSNVIEVYMQDKPVCPSWNDGNAALGIQNNDGDIAFVPPGRNTSDSPWTATNEAWSFSPAGDPTYLFEWVDSDGNVFSNSPTVEVCPDGTEVYTARVTYTNCNGDVVVLTDDVEVTSNASFSVDLGGDQVFCDTPSYDITAELDGVDPADATYLWSTGETTQTITVTTTDIYSVDVTADNCTITESVSVTFLQSPDCSIEPSCGGIDFLEDFGTGTGRVCDLNGATTTYICNTTSQVNDGEYSITNISDGLNTGWHVGMEDHTPDDVNGRMLFVNADDLTSGEFYRRTITLSENTDYSFNAWITTVYDTDTGICGGGGIPANVKFRIEDPGGTTISEVDTGDIPNGSDPNWQEYTIDFNTGANTDVQLVLINNGIGGCGNDLAIDDISLSYQNPGPQIVTPDDLTACDETGNEEATFDLLAQIPIILDGQDPSLFNVSFHLAQLEAEANVNAIAVPGAYVNVSNPETIYVRVEQVSDPSCFAIVDFDLTVDPLIDFEFDLEPTIELCEGDSFPTLDATPTNSGIDLTQVTYEWVDSDGNVVSTDATFTPDAGDTYTVTVSLAPCSSESVDVEILVTAAPLLDLGADEIICDGSAFEIVPTIDGNTQGITYLWSTGATTPTISVSESGDYSLEITVGPCVVSDSISVSIAENPIIELGEDFESCFDQDVILDASPANYDPTLATYQWFQDGTELIGETAATLAVVEAGFYEVIVTVGDCSSQDSITVTDRGELEVSLSTNVIFDQEEGAYQICPDFDFVLTANTEETDVIYQWERNGVVIPDESGSSLETTITQEMAEMGISWEFKVSIISGDCIGSDEITIYQEPHCVIPEGISPNGDKLNDSFDLDFLNDKGYGPFTVEVMNRHGKKVFSQSNYVDEFEGLDDSGNELPTGTYFYVIQFDSPNQEYGDAKTGWVYIVQNK